jgi:hypothetical protein
MSSRYANERKFKQWKLSDSGGRLYYRRIQGQGNWYALYFKEVDEEERTLRFWQEIFNEADQLVEIHEKYPVDKGHQKLKP